MEQGMAGYLFVHFTGEQKDGEQIYFSVSRDGLHWTDLNNGKPVLYSHIGECGVSGKKSDERTLLSDRNRSSDRKG